jgi:hypothetical protein
MMSQKSSHGDAVLHNTVLLLTLCKALSHTGTVQIHRYFATAIAYLDDSVAVPAKPVWCALIP